MKQDHLIELQLALQDVTQACLALHRVLTKVQMPEEVPELHDAHVEAFKRHHGICDSHVECFKRSSRFENKTGEGWKALIL